MSDLDLDCSPVDTLNLDDYKAVAKYFQTPLWDLPSLKDYEQLLSESEYAAWVIYNRYYLNHYTISVHDLPGEYSNLDQFNQFVKSLGIKLNKSENSERDGSSNASG